MNNNEQIITDIIDDLIYNDEIHFNKRITKEGLIECWSINANMDVYFDYKARGTASTTLRELFSIKKGLRGTTWRDHILHLYGYKHCKACTLILENNNFSKDIGNSTELSTNCKGCTNIQGKNHRANNKEYYKHYKENNKDVAIDYAKQYRKANKEKVAACLKKYYENNKEKFIANNTKRRASKLQRTPNWLTQIELTKIQELYKLSKQREVDTGIKQHVDHIIPLQGKLVSGLHVLNNLQVIPATDNLSKGNSFVI